MLLSGADQRLAAAAVCMGNLENLAAIPFVSPGSTDDAEQDFVDSGPVGFDRWDLFYSFAPKPMLICPATAISTRLILPSTSRTAGRSFKTPCELRHFESCRSFAMGRHPTASFAGL